MRREERPALPFEMVHEGVVNALIHRDYKIKGGKCQVVVTEDTFFVRSPGEPLPPITLAQLQSFTAPMLSRNPELHFVFARMGMAEEQGLGIASLRDRAKELGLPLPRYSWDAPYLVLTLYRTPESATRALPSHILESLNREEKKGWDFLSSKTYFTRAEYEARMGADKRKAERQLKRFVELGLVRPMGAGRTAKYEVVHS
jgi:ATP-dependent DNA helicase RecG